MQNTREVNETKYIYFILFFLWLLRTLCVQLCQLNNKILLCSILTIDHVNLELSVEELLITQSVDISQLKTTIQCALVMLQSNIKYQVN